MIFGPDVAGLDYKYLSISLYLLRKGRFSF
jgi:hypothetical protein